MNKTKNGSKVLLSSRTARIIGRENILVGIRKAISDKAKKSHVLYLEGPGGMGKTRILEEVANIQKQWKGKKFLWSRIIDLYHEENHSPENLQKAIVRGLDPVNKHFSKFQQLQRELEEKQRQGFAGPTLEKLRQNVNAQFLAEYKSLARKQRLVLGFDTVELIQYESDIVQRICQVEDENTVVKNWLLNHVAQFPNTVTVFAGRSQSKLEADFKKTFPKSRYRKYVLQKLTKKESLEYLDAINERNPGLSRVLTPNARRWVSEIAEGRPIRLTLCVDLLVQGEGGLPQEETKKSIDANLVYKLYLSPESEEIFRYLIIARKGLDIDLLHHLTKWSQKKIRDSFAKIRNLEIIKTRPGSNRFFLHDELYDLVDQYHQEDQRFGPEYYFQIADYYQHRLKTAKPNEREDLTVTLLYYEFQVDASVGYHRYYARLDEDAIKSHETGFDMRMRDEGLRFITRYANQDSPFFTSRVETKVDRPAIDRDCAVRWVKRYLARGEFAKAGRVAENVRYSDHPSFNWDTVDDPLYKAGLLIVWAEAMTYTSAPENDIQEKLKEGIKHLDIDQNSNEDQRWWRARILGRAHDRIGYMHRTRGRYGLALEQYKRALPYYGEADIPDERATTLNNLAFLLALLGRVRLARNNVDQALEIRQKLGRKYPLALSLNTRGLINVLEDHPMWGERDCKDALRMCEEIGDPRGIGLAHMGLGFALRKRGDQWKLDVYSQKEAEIFFEESEEHLKKATKIFSETVSEPIRLWEAYNELGSLQCDWSWLTYHRPKAKKETLVQRALDQYSQAIDYQKRALQVASDQNLSFQVADSYDDLAQAYADLSFLLRDLGRIAEADESLSTASSYLDEILEMIPKEFHLAQGEELQQTPGLGESYWLSLGKVHLQRGIWLLRNVERGQYSVLEREAHLREGIQYFAISAAYFHQYWPHSHASNQGLIAFASRLHKAEVSAELARNVVQEVAKDYQVNLDRLLETIDNVLGI